MSKVLGLYITISIMACHRQEKATVCCLKNECTEVPLPQARNNVRLILWKLKLI